MSPENKKLPLDGRKSWLVFLGLASIVVITLLVYVPAIRGDFIWDDDDYVSENPLLQSASGLA